MWTYCFLFVYSSVSGHLGCFHLLAIVNSAAINMGVQIYFQDPAFRPFGYICRGEIAGPYDNFIFKLFWEPLHCFSIAAVAFSVPTYRARKVLSRRLMWSDLCFTVISMVSMQRMDLKWEGTGREKSLEVVPVLQVRDDEALSRIAAVEMETELFNKNNEPRIWEAVRKREVSNQKVRG